MLGIPDLLVGPIVPAFLLAAACREAKERTTANTYEHPSSRQGTRVVQTLVAKVHCDRHDAHNTKYTTTALTNITSGIKDRECV